MTWIVPGQPPDDTLCAAWVATIDGKTAGMVSNYAGHGGKYYRVNAAGTALELVSALLAIDVVPIDVTADRVLGPNDASVTIDGTTLRFRTLYIRHSTPTNPVLLTLPIDSPRGRTFFVRVAGDQTGVVTLRPSTGATLQGGTADVTLDGPYASAVIECVANPAGNNAAYHVDGAVSLGQTLTGLTTLGEVTGQYPALGPVITANVTLDAAVDSGRERRITATSTVTITVPSGYRGITRLRNVSSVSHTVNLSGIGNRTIPAGALGIVDGNGTDRSLFIMTPAAS